ncbi:Hypothetical predicted protein [Cloeon dipterum]|uniref:Uncharacterized protein n=1 Tax=Cloeon dipterum TaxID=197152 RepID=A0A8S1D4P7_9INSE|nr:Hypothetical predicted protein [Cloeon dipterum]
MEKQQAAQAQEKREHHNKSRQQTEAEMDAPQQDELVPEKLERTEDPLGQATRFLTPLQELAASNIETHLMAFEIAIRKGKPLLMLQSIKRAHRIDPENAILHSCLVRFLTFLGKAGALAPAVSQVIQTETKAIFQGRDARQMNAQYLAAHERSLPARLEVARMMYLLDPSTQESAISLATALDAHLQGVNLKNCSSVLEGLQSGDFGACEAQAREYKARCHDRFPHAAIFRFPVPESAAAAAAAAAAALVSSENNNSSDLANNHDNNCVN